jgi:hypothetical protein
MNLLTTNNSWLEPFQNWIKTADSIEEIANSHDLKLKKVMAKEIFGSNLQLFNRNLVLKIAENQNVLASTSAQGGNIWTALRASVFVSNKNNESQTLVALLYLARTYFQNKI